MNSLIKNYNIMKNQIGGKIKLFKGAGYLIGFLFGTATAVLFVVITGVEALIGAIAASVSIPAGLVLEQKFQRKEAATKSGTGKFIIAFLALGIAFFVLAVFFFF
jgi:hypothetical protein